MGLRDVFRRREPVTVHRHEASPLTGLRMASEAPGAAPAGPANGAGTSFIAPASPPPAPAVPEPASPEPASPSPAAAAAPEASASSEPSATVPSEPVERPDPVGGHLVTGSAQLRHAAPNPGGPTGPGAPAPGDPVPFGADGRAATYDRTLIQKAWAAISDRGDELVRLFYAELFLALGGEAQAMFPAEMTRQRDDFGRALVQWVVTDDPGTLTGQLEQLGADHRKFAVEPRHYQVAGGALINAFRRVAGPEWNDELETALTGSYTRLASIMLDAAAAQQDAPAWWGATVVAHERIAQDFAVLRVQPDAPYAFRPGQYLTLEVARLPKHWRQMSFASAPRPDNTFDVLARTVVSTGVSGALVAYTEVGDRLRLGPPRGNDLVVEPQSVPAGLLCISAGTGAAPVMAVVESLLAGPDCPPIQAYIGSRTAEGLYPVEKLDAMINEARQVGHVRAYGVLSEDAGYAGLRGRIEDVVPTMQPWAELGMDVMVAGPDPMIAATVRHLTDAGVPPERIRFDQYDAGVSG